MKSRPLAFGKRGFDVAVASILLVALLPVLAICGLVVFLTMGGPVLYRQQRIGLSERRFTLLKFRTMREALGPNGQPLPDRRRLTRFGRLLRVSSLDELPQLLSVLRGDMSLIGPRPLLPEYIPFYTDQEKIRHNVRPGITGWAQVNGRNHTTWDERLGLDAWYVTNWSPGLDLKILARTVKTVARGQGVAVDSQTVLQPLHSERAVLADGEQAAARATMPPGVAEVEGAPGEGFGFGPAIQGSSLLKVGLHLVVVAFAYAAAFALRFDAGIPARYADVFWETLPLLVTIRVATLAVFRTHTTRWRHVALADVAGLFRAISLSSVLFVGALFLTQQAAGFPRSIILIDWMMALLTLAAVPFLVRVFHEARERRQSTITVRRTLVVGAGSAGAQLVNQLLRSPSSGIFLVGLVDDDRSKRFLRLQGLPVLGVTAALPSLVRDHEIDLIVIAIASAKGSSVARIARAGNALGVEVKVVPSLSEMLRGEAPILDLRSVRPEDLLSRAPIDFVSSRPGGDLKGRIVLVSGAAGSIGSELVRQVADARPKEIVLLDQSESPLVSVIRELSAGNSDVVLSPIVADVVDRRTVDRVFELHKPEVVFHAAAYKHVPMMEQNVRAAILNNVVGTYQLALSASRHEVSKFVLISTDKAVRPSSVMGATKRVSERVILSHPQLIGCKTGFRAVRFGNVLGSQGSVVPLFQEQIASGGPVTVTHPDMTRFFMTIPEAVQLVLLASSLVEADRRVSILEMGSPVRIVEMAEQLIRLSGFEPYRDIPIVFTGTRPGEKIHEELMSEVEDTVATHEGRIRIVQTDEIDPEAFAADIDLLLSAVTSVEEDELIVRLASLVPDCVPPLRDRSRLAAANREQSRASTRLRTHSPLH